MGKLWGILRWLSDLQGAITLIGGFGVASGVWAVMGGFGPWSIFIVAGVFCFGTLGYAGAKLFMFSQDLREKLMVEHCNVVLTQQDAQGQASFTPILNLRNLSQFQIHYSVDEFDIEFGNGRSNKPRSSRLLGVIAPHGAAPVIMQGFVGRLPVFQGKANVKIFYGRASNKLSHEIEANVDLGCAAQPQIGQPGELVVVQNVNAIEYKRRKDNE